MSALEALFIGFVQGLTEFLPISSSAHLKFAKMLLGVEHNESQVIFDLVCHFGTLIAVLLYLRKEVWNIFRQAHRKLLLLFIATLPLIPFYFLLKPLRDFASQPQFLGPCLLLTAAILFLGSKLRITRKENVSPWKQKVKDVLWIGAMQSAALIPGISRSASTISCAQVLGWDANEAVRFSFLLSIPTIIGGNCLETLKLALSSQTAPSISFSSCALAFLAACVIGLVMVRFAIKILSRGHLKPFAWYCLFLGVLVTAYMV